MPLFSFAIESALVPDSTDGGVLAVLFYGKLSVRIAFSPLSLEDVALFVYKLTLTLPLVVVPESFVVATPVKESSPITMH